jgi:hypothetical protein
MDRNEHNREAHSAQTLLWFPHFPLLQAQHLQKYLWIGTNTRDTARAGEDHIQSRCTLLHTSQVAVQDAVAQACVTSGRQQGLDTSRQ